MIGIRSLLPLYGLVFFSLLLIGCGGGSGGGGGGGGGTDISGAVSNADGFAQKGPFQVGGSARIQPLADDGSTDGEGIEVDIGLAGEFRFEDIDWHGPSLITVTGDWFSESAGNFAGRPLTLRSVVAIPDPDDADAESPFPTSVNLLTEAMTDLVLTRMADDSSFDGSVTLANNRLNDALSLDGDVRDLNLFVLDSQSSRDRQVSGVFAKIMIALSARDDLDDIIETAGSSAWNGNFVDDVFADLWQELHDEAAGMLEDGDIDVARTNLENNYGGVSLSRQLTNHGPFSMTFACNPDAEDAFGNQRLCPGGRSVTLDTGESRLFWFEAPHEGAFRFTSTTTSTELTLFQSISSEGIPGALLEQSPIGNGTAVGTIILSQGNIRYVQVTNANDVPRTVNLGASTLNAGSPQNPRWIFHPEDSNFLVTVPNAFSGSRLSTVGSGIDVAPLSNDHSYYRFNLPGHVTRVGVRQLSACVAGANVNLFLYRAPGGPIDDAWVDPDRLVAQASGTGGSECILHLDLDPPIQGEYLLKLVNRTNNVSAINAPSGTIRSYSIYAD